MEEKAQIPQQAQYPMGMGQYPMGIPPVVVSAPTPTPVEKKGISLGTVLKIILGVSIVAGIILIFLFFILPLLGLAKMVDDFLKGISDAIAGVAGAVGGVVSGISNAIGGAVSGITGAVSGALEAPVDFFQWLTSQIPGLSIPQLPPISMPQIPPITLPQIPPISLPPIPFPPFNFI
jgi:hypothetical protein